MGDLYDRLYPDTGSSNISRATPEWKEKLAEARATSDGTRPILHLAYELINQAVALRGEHWSKCMNCGSPYRHQAKTEDRWTDDSICSQECLDEFEVDLSREGW